MSSSEKVILILPFYSGDVEFVINKIISLYPGFIIIVINDNPEKVISLNIDRVMIVNNKKNMGLAKSMLIGYEKAISLNASFVIKLDPDFEYGPENISTMIKELRSNCDFVSCGYKRRISQVGIIDYLFNSSFSYIEALFSGCKMSQHSPGLQGYRIVVLKSVIDKFRRIIKQLKLKWGGDLLLLILANASGFKNKFIEISPQNNFEKRKMKKILQQAFSATKVIFVFLKNRER